MIEQHYLDQLQKYYTRYLSSIIEGVSFTPVILKGGKAKPATTKELEQGITSFLRHQKSGNNPGWEISWEVWQSKKLGKQQWPASVAVTTETDLLYLLRKEKEVSQFRMVLQLLQQWRAGVSPWLAIKPLRVLEYKDRWDGICAVVDYLLQHDVAGQYIRCLRVPVNTKFIEQNGPLILSLLKHLAPDHFTTNANDLESALGLQRKPVLCTLRWLDPALASSHTSGMAVVGVTPEALRLAQWPVREVWLVENETNLYLLPQRSRAIALFGKGYAMHDLKEIQMLLQSRLIYWGDLDEDGFRMLHQFRQMYPHTESLLMDEATVHAHINEVRPVTLRFPHQIMHLNTSEQGAWHLLRERSGRIEQEQIRQDWLLEEVSKMNR